MVAHCHQSCGPCCCVVGHVGPGLHTWTVHHRCRWHLAYEPPAIHMPMLQSLPDLTATSCETRPVVKQFMVGTWPLQVNRAARLMSAASGGQIVCDRALMDTVAEEWSKRYNVKREIEEPYSVQPGTQSVSYGQRINSQTGPNTPGHIAGRLASLLAGTRTSSQDAESMRSAVLNAVRGPGSNSEAPAGPALRLAVRQQSGRIRSLTSGGMNSPLGSDRLLPVSRTADNSVSSPQESRLARSFVGTSFSKCDRCLHAADIACCFPGLLLPSNVCATLGPGCVGICSCTC